MPMIFTTVATQTIQTGYLRMDALWKNLLFSSIIWPSAASAYAGSQPDPDQSFRYALRFSDVIPLRQLPTASPPPDFGVADMTAGYCFEKGSTSAANRLLEGVLLQPYRRCKYPSLVETTQPPYTSPVPKVVLLSIDSAVNVTTESSNRTALLQSYCSLELLSNSIGALSVSPNIMALILYSSRHSSFGRTSPVRFDSWMGNVTASSHHGQRVFFLSDPITFELLNEKFFTSGDTRSAFGLQVTITSDQDVGYIVNTSSTIPAHPPPTEIAPQTNAQDLWTDGIGWSLILVVIFALIAIFAASLHTCSRLSIFPFSSRNRRFADEAISSSMERGATPVIPPWHNQQRPNHTRSNSEGSIQLRLHQILPESLLDYIPQLIFRSNSTRSTMGRSGKQTSRVDKLDGIAEEAGVIVVTEPPVAVTADATELRRPSVGLPSAGAEPARRPSILAALRRSVSDVRRARSQGIGLQRNLNTTSSASMELPVRQVAEQPGPVEDDCDSFTTASLSMASNPPTPPPKSPPKTPETAHIPSKRASALKNDSCAICMEEFTRGDELRELPRCGHCFHRSCIDVWLTRRMGRCPLCREDIRAIVIREAAAANAQNGQRRVGFGSGALRGLNLPGSSDG
ncbi:hypothetical protein BJ742DRAFT_825558 [Cladochytrium replicatum]|nr:hypothetical protein BJ742DRAFT_825558 [Cladochytrium replicatum]